MRERKQEGGRTRWSCSKQMTSMMRKYKIECRMNRIRDYCDV